MENGKNIDLPITSLVRWEKNPRAQTTIEQNSDIEASIETKGVLLPLLVRARKGAKGVYEVIAGDRRRTTVQYLFENGRWAETRKVRCILRTDLDDDADALDVATSENLHKAMHPMDQFAAFSDMVDGGKTVREIANSYGVTTKVVEQRLSYAKLDARARDLVRTDQRDIAWASAMTIASAEDQAKMLDEMVSDPNRYRNAMEVHRRLETELIPVSHALFDISEAKADLVRRDIFDLDEPSYLPTAEFLRLQDVAVERLAELRRREGWGKVSIVSDREFDRWKYEDGIDDKARAEVVLVRNQNGMVVEHQGLALRAEARISSVDSDEDAAAGEALFGDDADHAPATARPAGRQEDEGYYETKATTAYLEKNRALVVQAMLMGSDRRLTLAITIMGMLSDSAPKIVEGHVFGDMKAIDAENATRVIMDRHVEAMSRQLRSIGVSSECSYSDNVRALVRADEGTLLAIHQVLTVQRVCTGMGGIDRVFDVVSEQGDTPLSSVWRPDRTFLDTLGTDQIRGLAQRILPERLRSKLKGRKTDMVETMFQHIDDAHENGTRYDPAERATVASWAPDMLGGAGGATIPSAFDDDGSSLFEATVDEDVETA